MMGARPIPFRLLARKRLGAGGVFSLTPEVAGVYIGRQCESEYGPRGCPHSEQTAS
jgi:hypothetical protein